MHDISFFLLKNWLPVGVSAILFFGIGLLLAKFIWGRFNHRLANAVEENMNLAGQWSALGSSQQDLFKKLRVRWQADRDSFDTVLAEKEHHITILGEQLKATGKEIPALAAASVEDLAARARVRELEAALAVEKAEAAKLRDEIDKVSAFPILPFAVKGGAVATEPIKADDDLQTRIRDLEQDLIDTHDELHTVRADYEKQVKLVESLEAKLIDVPAPVIETKSPGESIQLHALLTQRGRELRQARHGFGTARTEGVAALQADLEAKEIDAADFRAQLAQLEAKEIDATARLAEMEAKGNEAAALQADLEAKELALRDEFTAMAASTALEREDLSRRVADLSTDLEGRHLEIARLEESLQARESELVELEVLRRRRNSLQAELNDACHELYDVRRALNLRIEGIALLEAKLGDLTGAEASSAALAGSLTDELSGVREALSGAHGDLAGVRDELASNLLSLALANTGRDEVTSELTALQAAHQSAIETAKTEAEAVSAQLNDARRELSEVRIAFTAKSEEYQKSLGQMEELEAIIGDRSTEVNDLSTELRQQRDQARLLKNTLAGTQGELEALADESRILNAGVKARAVYTEEQQARISALETALTERYRELNRARVESDDQSRNAKHYKSRATQLESELERRAAEFAASDHRMATVETALDAANTKIVSLTARLEASESSLGRLRDELQSVSREKDETIRELDRATRRVAELEDAARKREIQLVEIERELLDTRNLIGPLEQRAERLQMELAKAREEHQATGIVLAEAEGAARKQEIQLAEVERELLDTRNLIAPLEQRAERLHAELESAREERRLTEVAVSELEEALRAGDERTLQLSAKLDEKETEVTALVAEVATLQNLVDARSAGETEAQVRLASLESALEEKIAELRRGHENGIELRAREVTLQAGEISTLREQVREQNAKLADETAQRESSLGEIDALREKLAARTESIRDLQNQISSVMMQRASRDTEIALLKDKLRAMEASMTEAAALPLVALVEPFAELEETFDEEGIPLDELPGQKAHHTPQKDAGIPESQAAPDEPVEKWTGSDEDLNVFFNEATASLARAELEKIDRCAKSIRRLGKKVEVTVIGYAGSEGTPDFTESLSARRADAVRERLVERGVSLSIVKIRAAGQDRRFSDWKARRVEMIMSPIAVAEAVN